MKKKLMYDPIADGEKEINRQKIVKVFILIRGIILLTSGLVF